MLTFSVNMNINKVVRKRGISDARPTTDLGRKWWSEAWIKTLADRTDETINLDAYGYTCEQNTLKATGKREVALLTTDEIEEGVRGVAATVASYIDMNMETFVEASEVVTFTNDFLNLQEQLLIEEGVNLWSVVKNARAVQTASIDRLRSLITKYDMGETIEGILSNPECFVALEEQLNANIFN